ncbi:MAG: ATP-binding cassette domain-containing protein, partial [Gammaproteobacteria bacterium]|nr:ATP-binding cassette domain-containing protein [Gammaproteobacteria bacterium]
MLTARGLHLRRGTLPLVEDANFTIHRGEKLGVTGANGAGKSSLFAALRGELTPDRGDLDVPESLAIAHVEQEVAAIDREAIEFVLDGDARLRLAQAHIERAEQDGDASRLAQAHAQFESLDGYRARARAAEVLHGLGFAAADHAKTVAQFSGGWRVRLAMARALASRADLLLLDEPTNHLDLDAILWLESWLGSFPGTVLAISHDREFLDAIADRILHIEHRGIRIYAGNYSQFERKRSEDLAQQGALRMRQERRIAEISAFVERFRAKATKSRQAQSRLKMLERMERIVPAHVDSPFGFSFEPPAKTPRPLVTLEGAACGYPGRTVLGGIDASIGPQDRIALLGPNGAGKSTLTRLLAGDSPALAGTRTGAADLAVGYFAQHQLDQLHPAESPFWHLRHAGGPEYAIGDEQRIRDHLGRFGFSGDRAFESVGRFSGGEKARLALALIVARRPNLLLLDEPTNHLDLEMRHALTVALQGFGGGLVVVSHDRHLIRAVADSLWLVADGGVGPFDGDLDDYQAWLRQRRSSARESARPRRAPAAREPAAPRP